MLDGSQSDKSQSLQTSLSDRGLLRLAFESAPTPMLCLDAACRCQAINRAAAELLGVDGSFLGMALEDIASESDVGRVGEWLVGLRAGGPAECEFRLARRYAAGRVVRASGCIEQDGSGHYLGAVLTLQQLGGEDLVSSQRKGVEQSLLEAIAAEQNLSRGLRQVVRTVEGRVTDSLAAIQWLPEGGEKLQSCVAPNLSPEFSQAVIELPIAHPIVSKDDDSTRRGIVIVENVEADSSWSDLSEIARRENVRACWSKPIVDAHGSLLGILAVYRSVIGGPTSTDLQLIGEAANAASVLLMRERERRFFDSIRNQLQMTQYAMEQFGKAVFWLRKDGTFYDANPLALASFRFSRDELLKKKFYELERTSSAGSWSNLWEQVSEQKTFVFPASMQVKNGQFIEVEVNANHWAYEGQEFVIAIVTDNEDRLDLYENSPYLLLSIDVRTSLIQQCNETMVRVLGRSKGELLQTRVFDLLTDESYDRVQNQVFPAFMATGNVNDEAIQMVCADGSVRDFIFNATAVRGDEGIIVATRAILRDVTEQNQFEARLEESEALFRNLAETSSFGVQRNDVYGRITFANPALGQIYGCPTEVLVGTSVLDFAVNEEMRREMRAQLNQQFQDPLSTPPTYETVHRTMDGRLVDLNVDWTVDRGVEGRVIGFIVVITDITERKRAERELAFRADVLDRVSDAIIVTDQQGNITYASEAARQFYHAEDLAGQEWMLADRHRQLMSAANFGDEVRVNLGEMGVWHGERELMFNGKTYWLEIMLKSFPSPSSGKRLLLTVIRDVSSRRMIELESRRHRDLLAHAGRLSTMGALVAGIAHEVKQPLYAISNYSTALAVGLRTIKEKQEGITEQVATLDEFNEGVQSSAQRANEIIRRMRDFAKRGMGERNHVDLNQVAIDSVNLLAFKARDGLVDVQLKLMENPPSVIADRIQCEQVVVNLLGNAYEALESVEGPRVVVVLTRCIDNWVELEIRDNGPGIDSDEMGYLFDPFYTTKHDGMGMGLAISETIVADHGGRLVARNDGVGTVFTLSLQPAESKGKGC